MRDPFRIDGPAVVSFSGGRTSAYMLRRILDAHDGVLPDGMHVVFTNTGKEREETLRFIADVSAQWGVRIRWVERDKKRKAGERWRETSFDTASRDGEPFAELIGHKKYLPNPIARFCTVALKVETLRDFMRAEAPGERWTNLVGLRYDEPARVSKIRARDHEEWDAAAPLFDAKVTKADVMAFWKAQPFDLALQPWESNCDLCFLKSREIRERIMRDRPDLAAWWIEQERAVSGRFRPHDPGYAAMSARVRSLPVLPMGLDTPDAGESVACACTE